MQVLERIKKLQNIFAIEFEKCGVYYISTELDDKEFMKIPVIVSSIDTE